MIRNTEARWGGPAKLLHWLGALLIIALLLHGWWMTHMLPRPERLPNYAWHSAIGYDLLALTVLRLLWRWLNPVPAHPAGFPRWEHLAAHWGHIGLYVLILVVSLTGWAVAATARVPITKDLLGVEVPRIVSALERGTRNMLEETHLVLAYVLAAFVVIHVLATLRHHFAKKNDVLRRMTWGMPAN
jgi:cytochrome b561